MRGYRDRGASYTIEMENSQLCEIADRVNLKSANNFNTHNFIVVRCGVERDNNVGII